MNARCPAVIVIVPSPSEILEIFPGCVQLRYVLCSKFSSFDTVVNVRRAANSSIVFGSSESASQYYVISRSSFVTDWRCSSRVIIQLFLHLSRQSIHQAPLIYYFFHPLVHQWQHVQSAVGPDSTLKVFVKFNIYDQEACQ